MSKRSPFARFIAQGYKVRLLHTIGKAAVAKITQPSPGYTTHFYAARHRHHHGEGLTPAEAIQAAREARKAYEASENEIIHNDVLLAAGWTKQDISEYYSFNHEHMQGETRAEFRRIATLPHNKAFNYSEFRDLLRVIGIHLSKPKAT